MEPVWAVCGPPGTGKSTLINKATNAHHRTGSGVKTVTSLEESKHYVANPDKTVDAKRHLADTQGIGDIQCKNVKEIMNSTVPAIARLISGCTGVVVTIGFTRLMLQELLLIKELTTLAANLPIILCFTKWDKEINDETKYHWTKAEADSWINAQKKDILELLELDKHVNIRFVSVSAVKEDLQDLLNAFEDFEKTSTIVHSEKIDQIRTDKKIQPAVNIKQANVTPVFTTAAEAIDEIANSSWFKSWFAKILKLVPIVGNIIIGIEQYFFNDDKKENNN